METLTSSLLLFFRVVLIFFLKHCQSRDGCSGDMAMTSTSRAIALRKRCVSSNLDKLTHDFLDDISSTDSEGNFYSWDFSMESKSA